MDVPTERSLQVVPSDRADEAFAVLQLVGEWIRSQGRRQRVASVDRATYQTWQDEQANFMVIQDATIVGLVTLRREELVDWPDYHELGSVWMLRGLACHPDYLGQGVGAFAVTSLLEQHPCDQPIFLDCVSEFLPDYYRRLGFEFVSRKMHHQTDGSSFDITLMRHVHETHLK